MVAVDHHFHSFLVNDSSTREDQWGMGEVTTTTMRRRRSLIIRMRERGAGTQCVMSKQIKLDYTRPHWPGFTLGQYP